MAAADVQRGARLPAGALVGVVEGLGPRHRVVGLVGLAGVRVVAAQQHDLGRRRRGVGRGDDHAGPPELVAAVHGDRLRRAVVAGPGAADEGGADVLDVRPGQARGRRVRDVGPLVVPAVLDERAGHEHVAARHDVAVRVQAAGGRRAVGAAVHARGDLVDARADRLRGVVDLDVVVVGRRAGLVVAGDDHRTPVGQPGLCRVPAAVAHPSLVRPRLRERVEGVDGVQALPVGAVVEVAAGDEDRAVGVEGDAAAPDVGRLAGLGQDRRLELGEAVRAVALARIPDERGRLVGLVVAQRPAVGRVRVRRVRVHEHLARRQHRRVDRHDVVAVGGVQRERRLRPLAGDRGVEARVHLRQVRPPLRVRALLAQALLALDRAAHRERKRAQPALVAALLGGRLLALERAQARVLGRVLGAEQARLERAQLLLGHPRVRRRAVRKGGRGRGESARNREEGKDRKAGHDGDEVLFVLVPTSSRWRFDPVKTIARHPCLKRSTLTVAVRSGFRKPYGRSGDPGNRRIVRNPTVGRALPVVARSDRRTTGSCPGRASCRPCSVRSRG